MKTIITIDKELSRKQLEIIAVLVHKLAPDTKEFTYEIQDEDIDKYRDINDEWYDYLDALASYPY